MRRIRRVAWAAARLAAAALLATGALVATGGTPADAHGYTTTPTSRAGWCRAGEVTGCGGAQWEPQSVEGPKGFPAGGPRDGEICAGGNARFAELDDPGLGWPRSQLVPGGEADFQWKITASHRTHSFAYFVTRDGWDPGRPLTRAQIEPDPFFVDLWQKGEPWEAPYPVDGQWHTVPLPTGKAGHHLILGVWSIADTGNAFYSCADVHFAHPLRKPVG